MFATFARRLTGWYVAAAVAVVAVLSAALAVVALFVYVHLINEGIDADAREAEAYAGRAAARHGDFLAGATEIETRLRRDGIRLVAVGPFPHFAHRPHASTTPLMLKPVARPDEAAPPPREPRPPAYVVMNGRRMHDDARRLRLAGSRLGFAVGTLAGARITRVELLGGELAILPDPDATERVALALAIAVSTVTVVAGLLAWFAGRYITSRVLRPLIEVTQALQRFAGRDFTPQPVTVAGKSEFDEIALAYNAAAAQVAAAFAERQQAEAQMRQFVADAGHELRTPLTIVLGYTDLLRRKSAADDERARAIFGAIAIEGARMRTLIDNLVLLARMESDDVRPSEPFALQPLLEEIAQARRLLHPGLQIVVAAAADASIIGSRDEILEAVANVVDNAIKYAPGSPIRIAVEPAEGGVELTVRDEGPGIHPDDRTAIFDRFFRGSTRGDVEGSGLGLAIAQRAVERAGGVLTLAETSPQGTTFAMRLRADRGSATDRSAPRTERALGA